MQPIVRGAVQARRSTGLGGAIETLRQRGDERGVKGVYSKLKYLTNYQLLRRKDGRKSLPENN